MLRVARFFIFIYIFVSIFSRCVAADAAAAVVTCCIVLCATLLHGVRTVTAHQVRLGTSSLAAEPECWWFSYCLMHKKSLPHFCFIHNLESSPTSLDSIQIKHMGRKDRQRLPRNRLYLSSNLELIVPKLEHLHFDQLPSQVLWAQIYHESAEKKTDTDEDPVLKGLNSDIESCFFFSLHWGEEEAERNDLWSLLP